MCRCWHVQHLKTIAGGPRMLSTNSVLFWDVYSGRALGEELGLTQTIFDRISNVSCLCHLRCACRRTKTCIRSWTRGLKAPTGVSGVEVSQSSKAKVQDRMAVEAM